jgi:hypothetical protein
VKYRRLLRQQLRRGERQPANAQELLEVMTPPPVDISGIDPKSYAEWRGEVISTAWVPPTPEELDAIMDRLRNTGRRPRT